MSRRPLAALVLAAVVLSVPLTACDAAPRPQPPPAVEDCDAEDWAAREDDCGYWDDGRFVPWSWVTPGVGGTPPTGWAPTAPRARARPVTPPRRGPDTVRPAPPRPATPARPAPPPRRR